MDQHKKLKFSTQAIHAGYEPDAVTGSVMPPIYMTSTYELESLGKSRGYEYSRVHNPNFTMLEKTLAALEDAEHATVFSSGIGALTAMVSLLLKAGDKVVAINSIYGGTYRFFHQVFEHFGVELLSLSPQNMEEVDHFLAKHHPKWMLFETPTNPLLQVQDIEALTRIAKQHGVFVVVDNTFASPYCQHPLRYGVDIVWHSTTKYISGHSDVLGGVLICNHPELKEKFVFIRKSIGVNPSPFDTWLILRGVKTLAVRMEQHQKNAMAVAQFLEAHPKVKRVYYPGLPSHPGHEIAKKQMLGFSGMVSAEFKLNRDEIREMVAKLNLFSLAESLGGIESLVCHPATMTHSTMPEEERLKLGITEGLLRFSIGLEDAQDLIEDLSQAL